MQSSGQAAPSFPVLQNKTDLNFIIELERNTNKNGLLTTKPRQIVQIRSTSTGQQSIGLVGRKLF